MGVYLGISHTSHPKNAEFQGSPIWGFSCIYDYTYNENDEIQHGNTYGEWHVFKRSAKPLHLHKCVMQFDRDS